MVAAQHLNIVQIFACFVTLVAAAAGAAADSVNEYANNKSRIIIKKMGAIDMLKPEAK